jgi:hypothetical protein
MRNRHECIEARSHEVVSKAARDQVPSPALRRFVAPSLRRSVAPSLSVRTRSLNAWSPVRASVPSASMSQNVPNVPIHRTHFARMCPGAPRRTIHRAYGKTNPPHLASLAHRLLGVLAFRLPAPAERSKCHSVPPATICQNLPQILWHKTNPPIPITASKIRDFPHPPRKTNPPTQSAIRNRNRQSQSVFMFHPAASSLQCRP